MADVCVMHLWHCDSHTDIYSIINNLPLPFVAFAFRFFVLFSSFFSSFRLELLIFRSIFGFLFIRTADLRSFSCRRCSICRIPRQTDKVYRISPQLAECKWKTRSQHPRAPPRQSVTRVNTRIIHNVAQNINDYARRARSRSRSHKSEKAHALVDTHAAYGIRPNAHTQPLENFLCRRTGENNPVKS